MEVTCCMLLPPGLYMRPPGVYWMWDEDDSGINVHIKLSADSL